MSSWIKITLSVLSVTLFFLTALLYLKTRSYNEETAGLFHTLTDTTSETPKKRVDFNRLTTLPAPAARYFKTALKDGQPYIRTAHFKQSGDLKISPGAKNWSQFKAEQTATAFKPGFIWDAKIYMAPLINMRVRDSLINGKGAGKVSLVSSFTIAEDGDHHKLNSAALHRFLAEAVWYPTALLPGEGVKWKALDRNRAIASLTDSGITVSLEFRFNEAGEVTGIYTPGRYGRFDGEYIKKPWEGRFSRYKEIQGMKIPMNGEVGWHLQDGFWLFWKGKIDEISYEF